MCDLAVEQRTLPTKLLCGEKIWIARIRISMRIVLYIPAHRGTVLVRTIITFRCRCQNPNGGYIHGQELGEMIVGWMLLPGKQLNFRALIWYACKGCLRLLRWSGTLMV